MDPLQDIGIVDVILYRVCNRVVPCLIVVLEGGVSLFSSLLFLQQSQILLSILHSHFLFLGFVLGSGDLDALHFCLEVLVLSLFLVFSVEFQPALVLHLLLQALPHIPISILLCVMPLIASLEETRSSVIVPVNMRLVADGLLHIVISEQTLTSLTLKSGIGQPRVTFAHFSL